MKETELKNTSETSEREVQNLSGQDKARKHRKTAKAAISFIVMIVLLVALFFAAVNIGSLKVSFPELLKGLFVKYNEDVATIYDLRFPRIVISMLAGAAIAVSGVLFQAVLKNPLADPGIIGISSGASFAAVLITAFAPTLFFFTPLFAFLGGVIAFVLVYSLSWKGGLSPLRIILVGVAVDAMFTGLSSALNSMNGGNMSGVAAIIAAVRTDGVNIRTVFVPSPIKCVPEWIFRVLFIVYSPAFKKIVHLCPASLSNICCNESPGDTTITSSGILKSDTLNAPAG